MSKLVQAGGTAKTTTAAALAVLLARGGTPTHLIDMDPQASLTRAFGLGDETDGLYSESRRAVAAGVAMTLRAPSPWHHGIVGRDCLARSARRPNSPKARQPKNRLPTRESPSPSTRPPIPVRRGRPPGNDTASSPKEKVTVWITSTLIADYREWTWEARCQLSHLVERALADYRRSCWTLREPLAPAG